MPAGWTRAQGRRNWAREYWSLRHGEAIDPRSMRWYWWTWIASNAGQPDPAWATPAPPVIAGEEEDSDLCWDAVCVRNAVPTDRCARCWRRGRSPVGWTEWMAEAFSVNYAWKVRHGAGAAHGLLTGSLQQLLSIPRTQVRPWLYAEDRMVALGVPPQRPHRRVSVTVPSTRRALYSYPGRGSSYRGWRVPKVVARDHRPYVVGARWVILAGRKWYSCHRESRVALVSREQTRASSVYGQYVTVCRNDVGGGTRHSSSRRDHPARYAPIVQLTETAAAWPWDLKHEY